ncbi:MAG: hypothetical protein ABIK37_03040 [candidate division WOR-3 bacterium]
MRYLCVMVLLFPLAATGTGWQPYVGIVGGTASAVFVVGDPTAFPDTVYEAYGLQAGAFADWPFRVRSELHYRQSGLYELVGDERADFRMDHISIAAQYRPQLLASGPTELIGAVGPRLDVFVSSIASPQSFYRDVRAEQMRRVNLGADVGFAVQVVIGRLSVVPEFRVGATALSATMSSALVLRPVTFQFLVGVGYRLGPAVP